LLDRAMDNLARPRLREFRFAPTGTKAMPARPCLTTAPWLTDHDVVEPFAESWARQPGRPRTVL
jgi:hypothetical protein